jgi:hypothetical protein
MANVARKQDAVLELEESVTSTCKGAWGCCMRPSDRARRIREARARVRALGVTDEEIEILKLTNITVAKLLGRRG